MSQNLFGHSVVLLAIALIMTDIELDTSYLQSIQSDNQMKKEQLSK